VIAATNRNLETAYREGTFRKDLYFRLNVVTVHLPPLRERKADIPALVHWFLNKFAPEQPIQITQAAMQDMLQYDWPGNIRELENCVERAVALGSQNVIDVHDLPPAIRRLSDDGEARVEPGTMNPTDLEELERETILRVFEQTKGDKVLTGQMLGISRATLYRKLRRYNIGAMAKATAVANTPN
jgi:DNA-binding NtrC family response regulator